MELINYPGNLEHRNTVKPNPAVKTYQLLFTQTKFVQNKNINETI